MVVLPLFTLRAFAGCVTVLSVLGGALIRSNNELKESAPDWSAK
jgi:hypothetical protein